MSTVRTWVRRLSRREFDRRLRAIGDAWAERCEDPLPTWAGPDPEPVDDGRPIAKVIPLFPAAGSSPGGAQ